MKDKLLKFLLVVLLVECVYLALDYTRQKSKSKKVEEGNNIISTPTPLPLATFHQTPAQTFAPTPTPSPKSTPISMHTIKNTSQEINGFIEKYSGQYGVDHNTIRHIAICESGFNQFAVNLSYAGLFQFGPTTWKNIRINMNKNIDPDLRFNAEESVHTAVFAVSKGKKGLWPNCYP